VNINSVWSNICRKSEVDIVPVGVLGFPRNIRLS
jgi:hypothetical protein